MAAFYQVKSCDSESGATVAEGVVRTYYLAAEKLVWDYAPSHMDLINNVSLTEADRWVAVLTVLLLYVCHLLFMLKYI